MADIPGPGDADTGGEIGLPAMRGAPQKAFPDFGGPAGGVDLPAPAIGQAGGFGVLDFADSDAGGGVDLPAARAQAPAPFGGSPFGSVDLPAARAHAPPPPPRGGPPGAALPAPVGQPGGFGAVAHLPAPAAALPAFGGGAGLPGVPGRPPGMMGGEDLPIVGGGGLPAALGGAGLPSVGGAGLPSAGGAGLPMPGGAGLPTSSFGALPMPSHGGLPSAAHGGLPAIGSGGLPMPAGPGLPSAGGPSLPTVGHAGLPAPGGPGLPMTADSLPSPAGPGLPSPRYAGAGSEMSLGDDPLDGGGEAAGIGAEVELDMSGGAPGATLPRRKERLVGDGSEAPSKGGQLLKFVAIGMVAVVGAGLIGGLFPNVGFFGMNFIDDAFLSGDKDKGLSELRQQALEALDVDTLEGADTAVNLARAAQTAAPRHPDTAGYTAFVLYMRGIRFGREGGSESAAKAMLDSVDRTGQTVPLLLASAAEDVLGGQLARARQTIQQVASQAPDDVDAAVLAGEIELVAKEPKAAIPLFTKAVGAHKSARTLFGLARAQMAAGLTAEAEATAKSVLELSKGHVSARTLLATIAASTPSREGEALELLTAVTKDEKIRKTASQSELVEAYIQLGRVQLLASRMSQAQEAYNDALKLNPQAVPALVGSGELFYRAGRYSEAEARFESATRADADNVDAKIGTAKTWISLERQKEAKDLLSKLQTTHPQEPRVFYWLGKVEDLSGKKKDAEGLYREAIKRAKAPDTGVPPYVALSHLLASVGRSEEATKVLGEAAEKYPNSGDLAKARGDVALQMGKLDEAQIQYEAALKIAPEDLAVRFALGQTFRKGRKFTEAIAVFDHIHGVDANYPGLALERGLYYEETGQVTEALQMYQQALDKAPQDVDLKLRIGSTLVAAGQAKQAEPILKEVVRERGSSAEANHFYGRALLLSHSNLNEAMRHLKKAVELEPNRAEYHLYVGWAANESGQPAVADASLGRAIELDATSGDAYWQLGVLRQKQGRTVDAIKDLQTALEKKPSRFEAYAALALCYEEQNNWTKAEESWRKALSSNDKVADWHYRFGKLLDRKNDAKNAVPALEKAIELAATRSPPAGWLSDAHLLLGRALRGSDKTKAVHHFSEFLRTAPPDNAYRKEAEEAVEQLKGQK